MKFLLLLCMFFLGFVASMQKFVSKQGVCIGTAGKICTPLDLKVCIRIHGVPTIFINECEACKQSLNLKIIRAPMTDYTYCYKNETEQKCCTGLR